MKNYHLPEGALDTRSVYDQSLGKTQAEINAMSALAIENLVKYPYVKSSYASGSGTLTGTVNADGSVTIDGETLASGNTNFDLNDSRDCATLQPGVYVLSGASENVALSVHYIQPGDSDWSADILEGANTSKVFIFDKLTKFRLATRVTGAKTISAETVYPMLEIGNVAHDFVSPVMSKKNINNRLEKLEQAEADGLGYVDLAANVLTKKERTIQEYDADTETTVERTITSYWTDELVETGVYNIRSTESKTIYDLPSAAKGTGSIITVIAISDRAYQRLEAKTGTWFRVFLFESTNPVKAWTLMSGGENSSGGLPDYWEDYLPGKITAIQKAQADTGLSGDSFVFLTDYHYTYNAKNSPALIRRILDTCGIAKVFFGGDLINHDKTITSTDEVLADITRALDTLTSGVMEHCFAVDGNHEHHMVGYPAYDPGHAALYSMLAKRQELHIGWVDAYGSYWVDNVPQKIRYFFLSCEANAVTTAEAGASVAAELANVPAGYTVVLVTHHAIVGATGEPVSSGGVPTVLTALQTLASGGSVDVACVLSGHVHFDISNTTAYDFPIIATTTDAYGRSTDQLVMTPGTTTEQAFDVVILDTANKSVKMIRIGAGENREFSYGS